jgi:hypothetical protein
MYGLTLSLGSTIPVAMALYRLRGIICVTLVAPLRGYVRPFPSLCCRFALNFSFVVSLFFFFPPFRSLGFMDIILTRFRVLGGALGRRGVRKEKLCCLSRESFTSSFLCICTRSLHVLL